MIELTSPTELRALLERHGLAPQKKWGQHFLVSTKVVGTIVAAAEDMVGILEVGPGPGVLTQPLSLSHPVIAYEVDPIAVSALAETAPNAMVRHQDALRTNLGAALDELPEPRAIVSNMPYNITGPLLEAFAAQRHGVRKLVLMMQEEVGVKILAAPGDSGRGAVSVVLQGQFTVRRLCRAPAGCFYPPPKVDSVVLELTPRSDEPALDWAAVRAGFRQPRKTLANNLVTYGWSREDVQERLKWANLAPEIRPHQLTEADWLALTAR